jgi:hypothetical protein
MEARAALHRVQHLLRAGKQHAAARTAPPARVDVSLALRDLALARPALTGADRRAADSFLARPTDTDEAGGPLGDELTCDSTYCYFFYLDATKLSTYETPHFVIHYYDSGAVRDTDAATPGYAAQVGTVLEQVYATETNPSGLGFHAPKTDSSVLSDSNPDGRIDIYLGDLGVLGLYGYCAPDTGGSTSSAYCALDNDFATKQFGAAPLNSLRVTAAHEFFHAIQFAYDENEAPWFMEGSAVWMEDEVFNSINDYRQYLAASPIRRPLTPFTNNGEFERYGAFTIFKFLAGYLHNRGVVLEAWKRAAAVPGQNSLQAVTATLAAHRRTPRLAFATFGAWNTLPSGGYPEASTYRPAAAWRLKTLGKRSKKTGTWRVNLQALANAPVVLQPGRTLSRRSHLKITVNAPNVSAGGAATLQVRYRNGRVAFGQLGLNGSGDRTRSVAFNPRTVSSVVVVLTNGATAGGARGFSISAKAS